MLLVMTGASVITDVQNPGGSRIIQTLTLCLLEACIPYQTEHYQGQYLGTRQASAGTVPRVRDPVATFL